MKKPIVTVALLSGIGFLTAGGITQYVLWKGSTALPPASSLEAEDTTTPPDFLTLAQIQERVFRYDTVSGNYLAGRFAQRHHDWETASKHIDKVIDKTGGSENLLKRSMVLAMGAGDAQRAFEHAHTLEAQESNPGALAELFLSVEAFKAKDYEKAAEHISKMPEDGLSQFIMPLLYSWSSAALGAYDTARLDQNTVHIFHAILISDFMNEHSQIENLLQQSLQAVNLTSDDIQRIADIYAHIKKPEEALELLKKIQVLAPDDTVIAEKIAKLERGETEALFDRIESPEKGVAQALFDMARILTRDYSDESARIFAQMAYYLNPEDSDITMTLAQISARNERYEDAIGFYQSIKPEDKNFLQAKRDAADLLEEEGRSAEALTELQQLVDAHGDLDARIQIGDIHRRSENFKAAIAAYNRAAEEFTDGVPADYWHLLYLRGMAYEQDGNWNKAEADLKAALAFQPDNPYVLNYLGYAWADKGENLEDAQKMIRKAVSLKPDDGYITDSLGWVLFRMNRFEEAVPFLEQAVELLPYDPVINDHLGDAYWQVGRKLEARFQWSRAKNHAEEAELSARIDEKLVNGLDLVPAASSPSLQEAHSEIKDNRI